MAMTQTVYVTKTKKSGEATLSSRVPLRKHKSQERTAPMENYHRPQFLPQDAYQLRE